MATATKARWQMSGQGYEFCNCDFGCGCNFGGFPNSKDGSCRALVGFSVRKRNESMGKPCQMICPSTTASIASTNTTARPVAEARTQSFLVRCIGYLVAVNFRLRRVTAKLPSMFKKKVIVNNTTPNKNSTRQCGSP